MIKNEDVCEKCISYCKGSESPDLLEFARINSIQVGKLIRCVSDDASVLQFAPAGNFPINPSVTVCGLATSIEALNYVNCKVLKESNRDLATFCAESVFKGRMAVNLFLMFGALGFHRSSMGELTIVVEEKERQQKIKLKSIFDMNPLALFGKVGYFTNIPTCSQFTQATCAWSINGKVQFQDRWVGYGKKCKENGYLYKLLSVFVNNNVGNIFLGMGRRNRPIIEIANSILKKADTKNYTVELVAPDGWARKTMDLTHSAEPTMDRTKVIGLIHHPANTKHIYNSLGDQENEQSVLFRFYDFCLRRSHDDLDECWKVFMDEVKQNNYKYYSIKPEKYFNDIKYYCSLASKIKSVS